MFTTIFGGEFIFWNAIKMFKTLQKLTALLALFCTFNAVANDKLTPQQWVQEMSDAQSRQNYQFTFVQTSSVGVDTYRYSHIAHNGTVVAQLLSLNGVKREILRRDNVVSYFQSNSQPFSIQATRIIDAFPSLWFADISKLAPHYDFIDMGKNRVADRIARTVRIAPKDDFRHQYVVFIDEESKLLLRSDLLDRSGQLLEQFQMVSLSKLENVDEFSAYLANIPYPTLLINDDKSQKIAGWKLGWLPAGFNLVSENIHSDEKEQQLIESRLYSDGLFSFTVYVADQIVPSQMENSWQLSTNTIYSGNIGEKEVTVIGQIPTTVAKRIAQEIQFMTK